MRPFSTDKYSPNSLTADIYSDGKFGRIMRKRAVEEEKRSNDQTPGKDSGKKNE